MPQLARTTAAAALFALLAGAPAFGGNWTLDGSVAERIELDTNLRLDEDDDDEGPVLGSTTRLNLALGYDARRTVWSLGSGISYRTFFGTGDDDDDDDDTSGLSGITDPRISGSVVHSGRSQSVSASFSAARRPVAFTRLEEAEAFEGDATETRLSLNAGWRVQATRRDSFSLGSSFGLRRFSEDDEDLTPSDSIGLTGGWSRTISPRTSGGLNVGISRFAADGEDEETETIVTNLGASLGTSLTPRHSLSVGAGLGRAWTDRELTVDTIFGPVEIEDDSSSLNANGSLGLSWIGTRRTSGSLSASQGLESTIDGDLANTTRIAAGLTHRLTRRTGLSFNASAVRRSTEVSLDEDDDDSDESSQLLRIASGLDTQLARRWSAGLGASFSLRREEDGDDARSASLFFELRRELVLNR